MSTAAGAPIVIIGAGQAGCEFCLRLRQGGYAGDIVMVGEEALPPYQRPPLSKKYLTGEWGLERILLRPASFYADERIELVCNARAASVDRAAQSVALSDGRTLHYGALVLATGAKPRPLPAPGADLAGVHLLRSIADVDAIRAEFKPGARLVVIGAGFIGLEAAASARQSGLDVVVIEAAPLPLSRVTSPDVAHFFLAEHTARGVRFQLGAAVVLLEGEAHVRAVHLASGATIPADLVVIGVGVSPNTALAEQCGLAVEDGILTDGHCRTSDPAIFAIGDCARRPMTHYEGRLQRLESVHNAVEGGRIAAAACLGQVPPALEAPWFWSDQYDLKWMIAGLFQGYDRTIVRGTPAERSFSVFYYRHERLIAVDAVNRAADYVAGKALIQKGLSIAPELLADSARPMKELVSAAV